MRAIKPKYIDTVKVDWKISKRSRQIISQYAKYTKYDEDEIVDRLIADILEDKDFIDWLKTRRYQKKIQDIIFHSNELITNDKDEVQEGVADFEEVQEDS